MADFRAVQARHEKSRRRQADGEFGSVSSVHFSSPSQTQMSSTALGSAHQISTSRSSSRRKFGSGSAPTAGPRERQSSLDVGGKNMSPMNPKRSSGLMSPGVSIGGALGSMSTSQGYATSPPGGIAARRRLLPGMGGARKGA
jgi:hypothetical protein